jgi:pimeloyl-ACP methyl ester carboxylesterase
MQWNLEEFLPGIKVPMLAIQGEQDQYGTPAQLAAIAKQAGGETQAIMLPDCAHAPHVEQTEATFAAMIDFILKIKSPVKSI